MKIKILFFCAVMSVISAQAQTVRLQGGINLANVSVTNNGKVDEAKMLSSFQVGIIGDAHLVSLLHLQAGLLYTGKGTKTQSGDPASLNYSKATTNPFYIELPVNFLVKAPLGSGNHSSENSFFVGAGPYLAVGINGKMTNEGKVAGVSYSNEKNIEFSNDDPTTLNYDEGAGFGIMRRFDYGLNGTVGIEGKSLVLSASYGLGLAKLQSGSNSAEDNNNKHRVLSFTLGFKL
ncbi:MAG: outer membrane beta-barrel protein [Flavisolibacter sp.]